MNVTWEQVLDQITDIENAICAGLRMGNIEAVMKEQHRALVRDRHEGVKMVLTRN